MSRPNNEEDLDDLDDVLEEFNKPSVPPPRPSVPAPTSQSSASTLPIVPTPTASQSSTADKVDDDLISEEFAKRFAEELEAMMRGVDAGADTQVVTETETEEAKKFREVWEKMIIEDLEADPKANKEASGERGKEKSTAEDSEDPFQKAIRQAMEKLQTSDETLKADEKESTSQDALENLLSTLGELNLEDGEGGEGLESMLESMMSQLMSKEILYDPLKELHSKYPEYLEKQGPSLPPDDRERYTQQSQRVARIVTIFDSSNYSDDDPTQSTEVLRLMNEMQSFGSPPSEIMGDMPPGFELGEDGLPKIPEGCIIA